MSRSKASSGTPSAERHSSHSKPGALATTSSQDIGLLMRSASRAFTRSQCPPARRVSTAMTRSAAPIASSSLTSPDSASIVATWAT